MTSSAPQGRIPAIQCAVSKPLTTMLGVTTVPENVSFGTTATPTTPHDNENEIVGETVATRNF